MMMLKAAGQCDALRAGALLLCGMNQHVPFPLQHACTVYCALLKWTVLNGVYTCVHITAGNTAWTNRLSEGDEVLTCSRSKSMALLLPFTACTCRSLDTDPSLVCRKCAVAGVQRVCPLDKRVCVLGCNASCAVSTLGAISSRRWLGPAGAEVVCLTRHDVLGTIHVVSRRDHCSRAQQSLEKQASPKQLQRTQGAACPGVQCLKV